MKRDLRIFLEEEHRLHFYDLLGGLADNLLTLGKFAGTFISCDSCGHTITLKDRSWSCECCGEQFSIHFSTLADVKGTKEGKVKVRSASKSKNSPLHWYFADENWSTGEFINILTRLPAEIFLASWFQHLGIPVFKTGKVLNILCWPRMKFGYKTIQPDFIVEFENDLVIIEFKRPEGGLVPPKEIAGQLIFLNYAGSILEKEWSLIIVPGPDSVIKSNEHYASNAFGAIEEAQENWSLDPNLVSEFRKLTQAEIGKRVFAIGWETLITKTINLVETFDEHPWTAAQIVEKLKYFKASRTKFKLFPNSTNCPR